MHSLLRLGLIVVSLLALFPPSVRSQIYFTSEREEAIYRVDFDGRNLRSVIDLDSALGSADYWPSGIAIHDSQLFWTDVEQEGIYTASLDGSGVRKLIDLRSAFAFRGFSVGGIAVTEDTIYWTDSLNTGVYSARRDGSNPRQILDRDDEQPLGILVDENRLFWTQWGGSDRGVYSSDLDGSNIRYLAPSHFIREGIALTQGNIFWISAESIYTAERDGRGSRELIHLPTAVGDGLGVSPRDLAVHEGQLFWTDVNRRRNGLYTARIDGSGTRRLVEFPGDVSIISGSNLAILPPPRLEIHVRSSGGEVEIEFNGILQSTEDLVTWFDVDPAPSSPYRIAPTTRARFFRARGRE